MRTLRFLLVLSAVATSVACTDPNTAPPPSPTSAFRPETPTVSPGALPTTSPGAATGNLTSGQVTVRLSGDVEVEKTLRSLTTAVYAPPPGALAIVWTAGGTDASVVGLGGASFTGSRPTSPTLSLSVTAQTSDGIASFLSIAGECEVTIDVAGEKEISGRFSCADLVSSTGDIVDVSASFDATG